MVFEAVFKLDYTYEEFFEKSDEIILNLHVLFRPHPILNLTFISLAQGHAARVF